jgi:hypothetical protein
MADLGVLFSVHFDARLSTTSLHQASNSPGFYRKIHDSKLGRDLTVSRVLMRVKLESSKRRKTNINQVGDDCLHQNAIGDLFFDGHDADGTSR